MSDDMTLLVDGEADKILCYNKEQVDDKLVTISQCQNCTIYILGCPSLVVINGCNRSLVFVATCTGSISYRNNDHGTLVATCRQFRAYRSNFYFYGFVTTDPVFEECYCNIQENGASFDKLQDMLKERGFTGRNKVTSARNFTPGVGDIRVVEERSLPATEHLPQHYSSQHIHGVTLFA
ncbi:unnamed protein product [Bursaphelenchus okinawaensis]|uniref:C-CAP/cofactor C-like domain-containing protein n=1 Tax=Bursaphelenchus okinawaensis TaxID=465554 RepID=A0A811KVI7_9BILA|nr:unnamed protein product [Bursaphelenchus okinawaensis]CAG9112673.1 unnamed protein product [Bursaphelenchus okinawaensis]